MAFYMLVTVLVLILNTGGSLGAEVRSSIIGGQDAPKGKWKWMVHLNVQTDDGKEKWRCGGTLLNEKWVMTSAKCLQKERMGNWRRAFAMVGSHSLKKESKRYVGIENAVAHPEFRAQNGGYVNDIALVKLKKKLSFSEDVGPVTLPSVDDTFGSSSECWITGWGNIGTNVPLPDPETLQELKIPIISQSACKAMYPELTDNMLCAGSQDGGMDACKGDYGGPLVCRKGSGFMQVGIMSYGSPDGCGLPGRPGVYTRVSKYLDWITYYMKQSAEV